MKKLDIEFNQQKVLNEAFKVRDKYIYLSQLLYYECFFKSVFVFVD